MASNYGGACPPEGSTAAQRQASELPRAKTFFGCIFLKQARAP